MPPGERLSVLADLVGGTIVGDGDPFLTDVTHDSRQAGPGALFVAVRGFTVDGHDYAAAAVERGASALAVEVPVESPVPQLVVASTRQVLGELAAAVHGRPSERLPVVGVTGTNGKTSVTFLLEAIIRAAGRLPGLIGTIQTRIGDERIPTLRTTPEATDFQRLLAAMVERGADIVVCEVSSHALRLGRVDATDFALAAFTNLSQDHLDFHADMEDYYQAKAMLFTEERARQGVVWTDDAAGRRLAGSAAIPITTVGTGDDADVRVHIRRMRLTGSDFVLEPVTAGPSERWVGFDRELHIPLPGAFNVANGAVAGVCAALLGIDVDAIAAGLAEPTVIPGRFELVSDDDPIHVVVDYAHTPAGIEGVIEAVRALGVGRVICVVGAGGDRDRGKRPAMGRAATGADVVVVTSDNPRNEDPDAIIDQVMSGVGEHPAVLRTTDRAEAIRQAIHLAEDGDAVLVLGKGHERGQEIAGRVVPFDDRMEARAALSERRGRA